MYSDLDFVLERPNNMNSSQSGQGLQVTHAVSQTVRSNTGKVSLSISNQSFKLGPDAEKEPAVVKLKNDLSKIGIANDQIEFTGASNQVIKGFFSNSEDNTLHFVVRFDLSQFQALCRFLDADKNCNMTGLTWLCADQDEILEALVERGLLELRAIAQNYARLLGSKIAGVHSVSHQHNVQNAAQRSGGGGYGSVSKMVKSKGPTLTGFWNSNIKVTVTLQAAFQLQPSTDA